MHLYLLTTLVDTSSVPEKNITESRKAYIVSKNIGNYVAIYSLEEIN